MRSAKRERALTEYISARLTPEESERVRRRAAGTGLTKSTWCREVVLQALDAPAEVRIVLGELMALRKIFLTIHSQILQGCEPNAQMLKTIVDEAEATKYAMADQRIQKFYSGESAA